MYLWRRSGWLWQAVAMGERREWRRRSGGVVVVVVVVVVSLAEGYGVELVEEVVRDWSWRGGSLGSLKCGGEVVEGEDVGGHHGHKQHQVQTHGETHRT
jgi:hypothetical protein